MVTKKKYVVGNPRNILKGTRILTTEDPGDRDGSRVYWYEGNDWVKPGFMPPEAEQGWIDSGFLVEKDG